MQKLITLIMLVCCCAFALEPQELVVVYNADSKLSRETAQRYCNLRAIPRNNCLPLYGVGRGDVTRADYDTKIKFPLMALGQSRGLIWPAGQQGAGQRVRAMVLMPDLPLRIKEEPVNGKLPGNGIPLNAAALDSELMLLGAEYPLAKHGSNPYFGKPALPTARERQVVLSVCRIDGPDKECIARMVELPPRIEKTGLWGWTVVDIGGPYKDGDAMMERVADICKQIGFPLFYESSKSTIANDFPLMAQTALYFGWYTNPANGPFRAASQGGFRFAEGALAFHLHSYSATSIYDGNSWVSALLKRGACVTAGNVAEPYLGACINYGLLFAHLVDGKQLGDAALLASPTVSWQCIVLGDPLYRPFPRSGIRPVASDSFVQWLQAVKRAAGDASALRNFTDAQLGKGQGALFAEIFAWYAANSGEVELAAQYFRLAADKYSATCDKLRASLTLVATLKACGKTDEAAKLLKTLQSKYAKSPYAAAIK